LLRKRALPLGVASLRSASGAPTIALFGTVSPAPRFSLRTCGWPLTAPTKSAVLAVRRGYDLAKY